MRAHLRGKFMYRAKDGTAVHRTLCGANDTLNAFAVNNLDDVTCKRCEEIYRHAHAERGQPRRKRDERKRWAHVYQTVLR